MTQNDTEALGPMTSLRPVTLVDQVCDAIVKGAAEGRFRPGARVVEAEISRQLNVSRVPVREALRLLESQGIVVNSPYRGMRLMNVDAEHLRQLLVVRSGLERLVAPDVVARLKIDRNALARLESCLKAMTAAVAASDGYAVAQSDTEFHRTLCEISGNDVLLQLWETLARRLTIIFGLAAIKKPLDLVLSEHLELLEVYKRGKETEIDRVLDHHIMSTIDEVDIDGIELPLE